jgi:hypothetical protein
MLLPILGRDIVTSDFPVGRGLPLTQSAFSETTESLHLAPSRLWALIEVETRGCGFLPSRRPVILFERHVFHRRTGGRFDATNPGISAPVAGGYGAGGEAQYARLAQAMRLARAAALASTSWGLGQIMGYNATTAGFASTDAMVFAMSDSEGEQLLGLARFLSATGCDGPLRAGSWADFARRYNGHGFARNAYDTRLAAADAALSRGPLPSLAIRAAQLLLTYLGQDPGPVDGRMGRRTQAALAAVLPGTPTTGASLAPGILERLEARVYG